MSAVPPSEVGATTTAQSASVGHTTQSRLAAAAALRNLGNAVVAHSADDETLDRITAVAGELLAAVSASAERPHAFLEQGFEIFSHPPVEGRPARSRNAFPDCIVSGMANPLGMAARLWREGEEAVCRVTLGPAFEGAPGRAHGGVVAALLDETMGLVLSIASTPAFTGRLAVTYRAPTPVGEPLEVRARLAGRSGRKMTITAAVSAAGRLLAEAEGLFIAVDPQRFVVLGP